MAPAFARTALGEPPVEVRWEGPEDCPSDAFTEALDRLLVGSEVVAPIHVAATVTHSDEGWSIVADFDAGPGLVGQRSFQAPICRTVTQAAALAVALTVDPSVLDRLVVEPEPEPEPEPVELTETEPEPIELTDPEPEPSEATEPWPPLGPIVALSPTEAADRDRREPAAPRWRGVLGVAGLLDGGALRGPGGGIAATVGVQHRRFRAELVGTRRFATVRMAAADARVGAELSQWSVGVRGCGVPRLGPVELPLCAGFDGGQTIGLGVGVSEPLTSVQPWLAGLGEAGVAWPVLPWLALVARASLAVPLLRQEFVIRGVGVVHRVGAVQGRGLVGLELRFP